MSDPPDEMVKYYGKYKGDYLDVEDFLEQENQNNQENDQESDTTPTR